MARQWNLQDAKARLSELVDRARLGEAQVILRRGEPAAVVISFETYHPEEPERQSMLSFLQSSPLGDAELVLPARDDEPMREVDL
jgi:prevent-host-death family protein